jgi:YVTN family beta-propeller protein
MKLEGKFEGEEVKKRYDSPSPDAGISPFDPDKEGSSSKIPQPTPPEIEEKPSFLTPEGKGRYVYIADTTYNRVTIIDSKTLRIKTVEVGDMPVDLKTAEEKEMALVVNFKSADLSILKTNEKETQIEVVDIFPGLNKVTLAPDGRHAIVYFDPKAKGADQTQGVYQDITLVQLDKTPPISLNLSVGFMVKEIEFSLKDNKSNKGFVITKDGISIIEFDKIKEPTLLENVTIVPDISTTIAEVDVSPNGKYAFVRYKESPRLGIVDLEQGSLRILKMEANITDMDVAFKPKSNQGQVVCILREAKKAALISVPLPEEPEITTVDLEDPFGQVEISKEGKLGILFTNVSDIERIAILDLKNPQSNQALRKVKLYKRVKTVAISPDGKTAVIFHLKEPGDPKATDDPELKVDRSYGYSLLNIENPKTLPKLHLTPCDPNGFLISPEQKYGYVLLGDKLNDIRKVHIIDLRSFSLRELLLASLPTSIGYASQSKKVFVSQEHLSGRITFISIIKDKIKTETITGYELNDQIE